MAEARGSRLPDRAAHSGGPTMPVDGLRSPPVPTRFPPGGRSTARGGGGGRATHRRLRPVIARPVPPPGGRGPPSPAPRGPTRPTSRSIGALLAVTRVTLDASRASERSRKGETTLPPQPESAGSPRRIFDECPLARDSQCMCAAPRVKVVQLGPSPWDVGQPPVQLLGGPLPQLRVQIVVAPHPVVDIGAARRAQLLQARLDPSHALVPGI